jgi:hypothetical protein
MYRGVPTQRSCARAWVAAATALIEDGDEGYNFVIEGRRPRGLRVDAGPAGARPPQRVRGRAARGPARRLAGVGAAGQAVVPPPAIKAGPAVKPINWRGLAALLAFAALGWPSSWQAGATAASRARRSRSRGSSKGVSNENFFVAR